MSAGKVRTARKQWHCRCAEPIGDYRVVLTSSHGEATRFVATLAEAEELAAMKPGTPSHRDAATGRATGYYIAATIHARANPNYQPACRRVIHPGQRYFEYLGETPSYQSGTRYCATCALNVWGIDVDPSPQVSDQSGIIKK